MDQEQLTQNTQTITFKQPDNVSLPLYLFALPMLVIFAFCASSLAYFYIFITNDNGKAFIFSFMLMLILLVVFSIISNLINYQTVSMDENSIAIKYYLPFKKPFNLNLSECLGYFSYSQSVKTIASHQEVTLSDNGIFLKFKNHVIQFKFTASNRIDKSEERDNMNLVADIAGLLEKGNIKNANPDEKTFIVKSTFLPNKDYIKAAKKAFLTLV